MDEYTLALTLKVTMKDEKQSQEKKTLKRRTVPLLPPEEAKVFEGIYLGTRATSEKEITDENTGEVTTRENRFCFFQKPGTEDKFRVWENAGLRAALAEADVKEGESIRVQHLGLAKMKSGRSVNQYDIFSL